jgi:hypothetical protein
MVWLKYSCFTLSLFLVGPLYMAAYGSNNTGTSTEVARGWAFAKRDSAGIAPQPEQFSDALIQVYAARTWSWRGHLAVHTWVTTKARDADHYDVHQVIGFRARRNLPVVMSEADFPDRYWYGNQPELLVDFRGAQAEKLLPEVLAAVKSYPYPDIYKTWPGPNSNTFTAHIGREVPELGLVLPVTAIGKDYLPGGAVFGAVPSGTGFQVSLLGVFGLMAAMDEGLELNILGLAAGVDFQRPALKLPGVGRIGMDAAISSTE